MRISETNMDVPFVDLFAGPGGLSEGFSSYRGALSFRPVLSVEKDVWAHKTLELRSFFRQFKRGRVPKKYYEYIRGEGISREELYGAFPDKAGKAAQVAWHAELGKIPLHTLLERTREAIGDGNHWVLLGGPPCQAYSTIGRARMKKMESFVADHRHTLYREYLKTVAAMSPTVFVMENVKGILSSRHNNELIFPRILQDLRDPHAALSDRDQKELPRNVIDHKYRIYSFVKEVSWDEELAPVDYLIESENHGIPQRRHRVILLGIRSDYDDPPYPVLEPSGCQYSVDEVIGDMPPVRSLLSRGDTDVHNWKKQVRRCLSNRQLKTKQFRDVYERMLYAVDNISIHIEDGGQFVYGDSPPRVLTGWLHDKKVDGVVQHESRGHMNSDFCRYLFSSSFADVRGIAPRLEDFPRSLWPEHANAVEDENGRVANFRDRFRVQLGNEPSTTITAHMRKDGHYFIHPDPSQIRSFTVREAARLQTFPDNYFFEGPRSRQFEQVGNAVPPYLAYQLADVVAEVIEHCQDQDSSGSELEILDFA